MKIHDGVRRRGTRSRRSACRCRARRSSVVGRLSAAVDAVVGIDEPPDARHPLATTRAARTGKPSRDWARYLDDALEMMFTSQRVAASVFEAVLEESGIPETASIAMPGNTSITAQQVKEKYADLYDHLVRDPQGVRGRDQSCHCRVQLPG